MTAFDRLPHHSCQEHPERKLGHYLFVSPTHSTHSVTIHPKPGAYWILGDIKFAITKMPSRKMRFMMKLFFDWGFEKIPAR